MPSSNIVRQIIDINGTLYEIKKTYKEYTIKDPLGLKDFLCHDIILKKEDRLYYCDKIQELEYEEINQNN